MEKLQQKNYSDIYEVYADKLASKAGKIYQCSSVEEKHQMVLVCFKCYVFYKKLQHKIFNEQGKIKYLELQKISDPQYKNDKRKQHIYNKIRNLIQQRMNHKIQK